MITIMNGDVQDKRPNILDSAVRVFAMNGFEQAKISEIAKESQIAVSGLYTYFESKEDILFAIIEDFLLKSIKGLKEHLEGIQGTGNKLRKAVWFHCKAYSSSRKEIQIILESRSYPRFYKSHAYEELKNYSRIFMAIIEEGIANGSLCNISSPSVLRDMILGTVDHVAINWTIKNAPSPLEMTEHLFELIINSVTRKEDDYVQLDKKEAKRKRIINEATQIFAQKGYKSTNIGKIALSAGVAEGTIYEYYQNKENLLISIPEGKLSMLLNQLSGDVPEEELKRIIHTIFAFHNNNRDYSTVLVLMLRPNKNFYYSESNKILDQIFDIIQKIIAKGQAIGKFKKNLDPEAYRSLLFGSIDHIIIPWIIFNRQYDLIKVGDEVSKLFINAIKSD